MVAPTDINAMGVAGESSYGTETSPIFYEDIATVDLDSPAGSDLIHPGGLTRYKRTHNAGIYIPTGNVELVVDPLTFYYYIKYFLTGSDGLTFTDNTTSQTAEELLTTGAAETTGSATADEIPIIPGTLNVEEDGGGDVAGDDGFGNITAKNASGVTGWVDYGTGTIYLTGLSNSTTYDIDYDEAATAGFFNYVMTPTTDQTMKSITLDVVKQQWLHTFIGAAISQIEITFEKEWATMSMELVCQKDKYEARPTLATVSAKMMRAGSTYPTPFHQLTVSMCDYGGSLSSEAANVESCTITMNNNADAEAGTVLNSRHPAQVWLGEFECAMKCRMVFADQNEYVDYWGAATGPSSDPSTEKVLRALIGSTTTAATNGYGNSQLDIYKAIITDIKSPVSGRERITQEVTFEALFDDVESEILQWTCNAITNWDSDS
jgi:hypothetical protein